MPPALPEVAPKLPMKFPVEIIIYCMCNPRHPHPLDLYHSLIKHVSSIRTRSIGSAQAHPSIQCRPCRSQ